MKGRPSGVSSTPPSPRTASEIRNPSAPGTAHRGRVELNVFRIDDSRPGAIRHCETIAARPCGLVVLRKMSSKPAGGQDGR